VLPKQLLICLTVYLNLEFDNDPSKILKEARKIIEEIRDKCRENSHPTLFIKSSGLKSKPKFYIGGFHSDEQLIEAIDKFTYDNGLTQILVASSAGK
jgi:hypothetical protein